MIVNVFEFPLIQVSNWIFLNISTGFYFYASVIFTGKFFAPASKFSIRNEFFLLIS